MSRSLFLGLKSIVLELKSIFLELKSIGGDPYFLGWADIFSEKKGAEKPLFIVPLGKEKFATFTMK